MGEWEYRKMALNQLPRNSDDVDLLTDAGQEGWELVAILENNVAYLKRQVGGSVSELEADRRGAAPSAEDAITDGGGGVTASKSHEVKAKYRDPVTNDAWSGRGRMANWLKRKQDAGEDIDDYLV